CADFKTGEPVQCNLHSYWDNVLVQKAIGKSSEIQFARELAKAKVAASLDVDAWIKESNTLAKEKAHHYEGFACKIGKNSIALDSAYDGVAVPLVKEQLAKGGLRLAAILNHIYK